MTQWTHEAWMEAGNKRICDYCQLIFPETEMSKEYSFLAVVSCLKCVEANRVELEKAAYFDAIEYE